MRVALQVEYPGLLLAVHLVCFVLVAIEFGDGLLTHELALRSDHVDPRFRLVYPI